MKIVKPCCRCALETEYTHEGVFTFAGGFPEILCDKCKAFLEETSNSSLKRYEYIGKLTGKR